MKYLSMTAGIGLMLFSFNSLAACRFNADSLECWNGGFMNLGSPCSILVNKSHHRVIQLSGGKAVVFSNDGPQGAPGSTPGGVEIVKVKLTIQGQHGKGFLREPGFYMCYVGNHPRAMSPNPVPCRSVLEDPEAPNKNC